MTRAGITKDMLVQLANDDAVIIPTSNKDGWPICCIEYEDEYGDVPNLDFHVPCEDIRLNQPIQNIMCQNCQGSGTSANILE